MRPPRRTDHSDPSTLRRALDFPRRTRCHADEASPRSYSGPHGSPMRTDPMPEYRVWRRMSGDHCARCQRAAPDANSHEFMGWEALNEEGDIICPGRLSGAEVEAIEEDYANR